MPDGSAGAAAVSPTLAVAYGSGADAAGGGAGAAGGAADAAAGGAWGFGGSVSRGRAGAARKMTIGALASGAATAGGGTVCSAGAGGDCHDAGEAAQHSGQPEPPENAYSAFITVT